MNTTTNRIGILKWAGVVLHTTFLEPYRISETTPTLVLKNINFATEAEIRGKKYL